MIRLIALSLIVAAAAARAEAPPRPWTWGWPDTDFSKSSVPFAEILSGGPGKDGIPAVTDPAMRPVAEEGGLSDREPVVTVAMEGETPRAYPIRYLTWHEIVNDRIGATPVAVTFCPLCNSAVAFDRRLEGRELEFGVSGMLRNSDMIMYDRQTESWWQQFLGEAVVGELTGARLVKLPVWMESWAAFRDAHPEGLVMAAPTVFTRPYGRNPYQGYDSSAQPFLYRGENPPHGVHPLARVVAVGDRAWPLARLAAAGEIVEDGLRLTWAPGQGSALDASDITAGREVGDVRVRDAATGAPVVHDAPFAFAFHAFHPDGRWMID